MRANTNINIWLNTPRLAFKTLRADRGTYRGQQERAVTLHRLARLVRPALQRPLFVIGSPRSGTTFLGDCIAVLPEVTCHHEPIATKYAARKVYEDSWSEAEARFFYRSVYRWLMRIRANGDLRFAEKTPRNCFIIPFLHQAFPDAQFVHILRDGRDAALSHSRKPWLQAASAGSDRREPGGYPYGPYARFWVEPDRIAEFEATTDLHRCIWAWRRHVESALEALKQVPEAQRHTLRYEALVAQPAREADRLLDFLGIHPASSRQRFREAVAQARPDSVGNWKAALSEPDLDAVEAEAGPLLRELGYL